MLVREAPVPHALWGMVVHRYSFAVLVVCLAGGLTSLLRPVTTGTPFLFFFAAVMGSAWYGGLGPSLLTILLAAGWSVAFVLPAQSALQKDLPAEMVRLTLFLLVAFGYGLQFL